MISTKRIEMNDFFYVDVTLEDSINEQRYVATYEVMYDPLDPEQFSTDDPQNMIKVELLHESDFYEFLEKAIRMDPIRLKKFNNALSSFIDEFKQDYKNECESI